MFQTAFPFGYLIQFVLFVGAIVVASVMIAGGLKVRDRILYRAGLVLAVMIAMVMGLALAQPNVDDWNPRAPREVLHGRWADREERSLDLRADGTFTLRQGPSVTTGFYDLEDWSLRLMNSGGGPLPRLVSAGDLRVVEADGEYRIINDPVDPDGWDGWMGYRHDPPAKVR